MEKTQQKMLDVLIRTNSDDEIKNVRAEFKNKKIKFNENCDKTLRKHRLTEEEIQRLDLSKIGVFQVITAPNSAVVSGLRMLVNQNPITWNR